MFVIFGILVCYVDSALCISDLMKLNIKFRHYILLWVIKENLQVISNLLDNSMLKIRQHCDLCG